MSVVISISDLRRRLNSTKRSESFHFENVEIVCVCNRFDGHICRCSNGRSEIRKVNFVVIIHLHFKFIQINFQ